MNYIKEWVAGFFLYVWFLSTISTLSGHLECDRAIQESENKQKILVLIIASDDEPCYIELQRIWRSYMHQDLDHVETYFIKADPSLPFQSVIDGDVIWSQSSETIIPGIINKTIMSMELLLPRIKTEFNY